MLDLHDVNFPKLKEEDCNRSNIKNKHLEQNGKIAVENLKKNKFEAYYCSSSEKAKELVLNLIPDDSIIGCGDSHTVFELELDEELDKKNCVAIPHTCAVNKNVFEQKIPGYNIIGNKEETRDILMQYLVSNVFMLGANAVTLDGQIINIDGAGNRIAGSLYGSDKTIVIAGANKIVKDLNEGLDRIRNVSAQMNNIKYNNKLPCNITGECKDCASKERYCNITNIIHKKPLGSDFHVIIIGEELGF